MRNQMTRRDALRASAALGAGLYLGVGPRPAVARSANEKINIACIGVGGRGAANVGGCSKENLVAFCDVDEKRAGGTYGKYPGVKRYTDYRKMLDEMENKIDAVVVSTPDHTHFHPSMAALERDKHLYCEKPMAHNVWEIRTMTETARKRGLATQLGVQRHTLQNMHRSVEEIQSGLVGEVSDVYCWVGGSRGMPSPISNFSKPPEHLDWELWLGPTTARRGYTDKLAPYNWRFWWDYGTGETGNWGCHILDIPYWALDLKYPTRVEGSGPEVDAERTPKSMVTKFQFAASDVRPEVNLHWSHGTPEYAKGKGFDLKSMNTIFVGSKGTLVTGFSRRKLYRDGKPAEYDGPEKTIAKSPGFYREWFEAIRGGEPATCNFDYSGPLSETVLLGNVAYRGGGFDWNWKSLQTGGNETAQGLIREEYAKGWEV